MFEKIEKYLLLNMEKYKIPSLSIAIAKNQNIIFSKAYGYVNIEEDIPATNDNVYRVASMTKQIIATALLQYLDDGNFRLDDRVNDLLDNTKIRTNFDEQPTVRHLLMHTSGLPAHVPPIYYDKNEGISLEELVSRYGKVVRPPNVKWVYSNTAYNIMGYLVSKFSGQIYSTYVKKNLLKPLEMDSSEFEITPSIEKSVTTGYHFNTETKTLDKVKPYIVGGIPEFPSSSLYTTANDFAQFLIAHMNDGVYKDHQILTKETVREMQKVQWKPIGFSRDGMGLSWIINWQYGHKSLWQHGSMPGVGTYEVVYPELNLAIVILTNVSGIKDWRHLFAGAVLRILLGDYQQFDPEMIKAKEIPNEWRSIAGEYGSIGRKQVIRLDNNLLIMEDGESKSYLEEIDRNRFLIHGIARDGTEILFDFDDKGKVIQFYSGTSIVPRYSDEDFTSDMDTDLIGTWCGEYINFLHPYMLVLRIENETSATITDMVGDKIQLTNFNINRGKIKGRFKCKVLPEYTEWIHANEMQLKLNLSLVDEKLKGYIIGRSTAPVILTKT